MFDDDYVPKTLSDVPKQENPCEDVSVLKSSLPIELAIQPKSAAQCKFEKSGVKYKINTSAFDIDGFLKNIPIMEEPPKEDGIYTWILAEKFACCRVLSMFEIGTIHQIIVLRTGSSKIIAAGELKVEKGKSYFNFMSGTYMLPLMKNRQKKKEGQCNVEELDEHLTQKMKTYFPEGIRTSDETFIVGPPSDEELALYVKYGAKLEKCLMGASRRRHRKKRNTVRTKRSKRK
jgi:hypothetical protein